MLLPIALGAVLGGLFVFLVRRRKRGDISLLALGLVVAAFVYLVLALAAGADRRWLILEAVGLGVFGLLAWLGLRASLWWLVLGWVAHVGWDVGLHLDRPQTFVPAWYPLLCVGFDLVVAGFLLGPASAGRPSRPEAA
jgi:Family of unknown function (DUF6010)